MISPALHQWTTWVSALCHQHCQSPAADCVSVTPQRRSHELRWLRLLELPSLPSHLYNWLLTRHVPVSPTKLQAASPERNQVLQGLCRIGTRQGRKQEEKKERRCLFLPIEHTKHRASIPNTRKKTAQSSHHVNNLCIIRCLILLERSGFIKSIEGIFSSIDRTVMSWQFKGKAMSSPIGLPVPFIIFPCFIIFDHLKAGCQAVKCSL